MNNEAFAAWLINSDDDDSALAAATAKLPSVHAAALL
jgi:hypothetical protein